MIKKERAMGALNSLVRKNYTALSAEDRDDASALQGVAYDVANAAIVVYREKIAAGLRRGGIDISDTEDLNVDVILAAVKVKTGVDLRSFDIEEVKAKALAELSTDISRRLGFDIDLTNGVQAGLEGAVDAAIRVGGSVLLNAAKKGAIRRYAIAAKAGVDVRELEKVYNAKRQAEWRKNAPPAVWVTR